MIFFKRIINLFIWILFIGATVRCSLDDKYHYTLSYQVNNQTQNSFSGILIRDSAYYLHPEIEFDIEGEETIELFTGDGGDGATVTPPYRQGLLAMNEFHINSNDTLIIIDVESAEKWEYTTKGSTGIYTFYITPDLF